MQKLIQTNGALLWNIKKIVSKGDYKYAIVPEYPNATKHNYVLLHRVVMENYLGRVLNTNEVVHHLDGNKLNNTIENLQVLDRIQHNILHLTNGRSMVKLKCPQCEKEFVKEKNQTHLIKSQEYTCCSKSCRGKFSRTIQLYGKTEQVKSAISVNLLSEYNSLDNTEGTVLQQTP